MLFAGIDGGQSSTTAAIARDDGVVLARGSAGPADEVDCAPDSSRLNDALNAALADALKKANLDPQSRFSHVVAGVSGYEGRIYGAPPTLPADRTTLLHDAPIAQAGAFNGGAGIVVIAGTGSVVYGVNRSGESLTLGGWGYVFGDEGSAFALIREALRFGIASDDAGAANSLTGLALQHFDRPSLRSIVRAFYQGEITRQQLAGFAPSILQAWLSGDEQAGALATQTVSALARLVATASERLSELKIAPIGGMFASAEYQALFAQHLSAFSPTAQIVGPICDPAEGALRLAIRG
ncbi:MAG: hypothetical protein M3Y21_03910 [Candidatus Eremiobacteraeota bacterium]|nr:hypothetical protein [Candidatus Eremiobacteraeota bacterium]